MEIIYNKLVRDNIPDIIRKDNKQCVTRILDEKMYKVELEKKLYEEYKEVLEAGNDTKVEELADMLEIMVSIAQLQDKSLDDIIRIMNQKREKRGGFEKKIFLEKVIQND